MSESLLRNIVIIIADGPGSGNGGPSSATSDVDVLLSPTPARAHCIVDSLTESTSVPKVEPDPEAADRGTDDIISSMTVVDVGGFNFAILHLCNADKDDSESKSAGVYGGS